MSFRQYTHIESIFQITVITVINMETQQNVLNFDTNDQTSKLERSKYQGRHSGF